MTSSSDDKTLVVGLVYGVRLASGLEYRYVGLTTKTASLRLCQHRKTAREGKRTPFCDWLRKHAEDEIAVDVLEYVTFEMVALGEAEIEWIVSLRSLGHRLLNVANGGLGPTGVVWTAEQREAARLRSTGRQGLSRPGEQNPFYGRRHSEEQRARWAESRAALSEMRKGELNPNFGRTASPETRAKRSAAQKGVPKPSSMRSAHIPGTTPTRGGSARRVGSVLKIASRPPGRSEREIQS